MRKRSSRSGLEIVAAIVSFPFRVLFFLVKATATVSTFIVGAVNSLKR